MAEPAETRRRGGPGKWIAVAVLVAAALLLVRMLGPGGRPAEEGRGPAPPLAGRILRADGTPVASAVVEAVFETGAGAAPLSLRSPPAGSDGRFVVPGAPEKWTSLRIRVRSGPLALEADLGDAPGPLDLSLALPSTFTVAGIVVSTEGGRPLPGMDVRLSGKETRTDDLGRFRFPDLPATMAGREPPVIEVSGRGRRTLRRPLSWEDGVDDLLLHLEP
jgi:hypothetical protein